MLLQILLADGADVAERMHAEFTVGVVARLAGGQIDAREFEAMHREAADLLIGQAQPHRHAVEAAAREDHAARVVELIGIDAGPARPGA